MKHHEFWDDWVYLIPYSIWVLFLCLVHGLPPSYLLKANYGIDHGGFAFASKYRIQHSFGARKFAPTMFIPARLTLTEKKNALEKWATTQHMPFVLKPDYGFTGRGVFIIRNKRDLTKAPHHLGIDYIAQAWIPGDCEFGIFITRRHGTLSLFSINQKHFPTVTGDGINSVRTLARRHPRYSARWESFLKRKDLDRILRRGQTVRFSSIGSHAFGCKYTDETKLTTPSLMKALHALLDDFPGFNFGRIDVKASSPRALQEGKFSLIEVNGVDAFPSSMYDPSFSVFKAFSIFLRQGYTLVRIAQEHRHEPMDILPTGTLLRKALRAKREIIAQHSYAYS